MADVKLPELPEWAFNNRHLRHNSEGMRRRIEAYARAAIAANRPVVDETLLARMEELADEWEENGWPDPAEALRAALTAALAKE